MKTSRMTFLGCTAFVLQLGLTLSWADWTRFRGPNGSGHAPDNTPIPTEFGLEKNLAWKTPLPGPGSSSPIISGNRIFVTCWSGYGEEGNPGKPEALKRHLVCVDRESGKILWDKSVPAKLPEQEYGGMFAQHGFASHTPVTDGKTVYAFFGKSGVYAFNFEGDLLWESEVGEGVDERNWGSSSSPILTDDLVVVPAIHESHALYGLNKNTGKMVWKSDGEGYRSTWGSPVLSTVEGRTDVVIAVPQEVWAVNTATGKLSWFADGIKSDAITGSVIENQGIIYATGSRGAGSVAIRSGGDKDVSKSHIAWRGRDGANIMSPVYWDNALYWISGNIAQCRDAETGEEIYSERLPGATQAPPPPRDGNREGGRPGPGGGPGRGPGGGGRGGGGGFGGMDYASPVVANGYLYQVTRSGDVIVIKLGKKFEFVARNSFSSDGGDFSATPALSDGQMVIRSTRHLYSIQKK